jgi:hypothetical protein
LAANDRERFETLASIGAVDPAGASDLRLLEAEIDRVKAAYKQMKAEFEEVKTGLAELKSRTEHLKIATEVRTTRKVVLA